jgi:hypothetical protein
LTNTLWRLFGQNVAFVCLFAFKAIRGFFEAFCSSAFGFEFDLFTHISLFFGTRLVARRPTASRPAGKEGESLQEFEQIR